jgi:DNA-binding CsgD family transcriptional regulator
MTLKSLKYLLCAVICFFAVAALAEDIKSIGVPYIQNYPKSVYQSGNQNWSVAKDKNGVMYFGNAQGLLTYDGRYWHQYEMPNRQIVRAVATGSDRVYTGGFGEFGYWSYKNRRLVYTSLIKLIPKPLKINDEIWKIYVDGSRVIFQSFKCIYIYQGNEIKVLTRPEGFLFLHQIGKRFCVEILNKGLFELKGNALYPLKNSGPLLPGLIMTVLPYKDGRWLVGTSSNGLFLYDGERYTPFKSSADNFLKTYQLNNGSFIMGRYYAFGTILNGLVIIDEQGNMVQQINKTSGMQNNTVLSLFCDNDQNLWTGLDNGIDRVELNSPLYAYFDKSGLFGTVYSSLIYKGHIYLGTNQGLFYSIWPGTTESRYSSFDFKLIPGSQGQVWDLTEIDGQLLCGHNSGTFRVDGNRFINITYAAGGWTIKKLKSNPEFLIQGSYNGLIAYKKNKQGLWVFHHEVAGFREPSRYVEQDEKGDLWIGHAYKGLYRLKLNSSLDKVLHLDYYSQSNGLPDDFNINIFSLQNKLVYSSDEGFYNYDEISNRFSKYTALNKALGSFAGSNKIIAAGSGKYWFIDHGRTALADLSMPGRIHIDSSTFSMLNGRMVQYYENISRISNGIYLISVDDGFIIYDAGSQQNTSAKRDLPAVLIRKVEDITDTVRVLSETGNGNTETEIPFAHNNIRIAYALPFYRQSKVTYQYFLEGYSRNWSEWDAASQKDFTNLSAGTYIFKVRARINAQQMTGTTQFRFTILPPFYLSKWAFILYVILFAGLLLLGRKLYERKLKKDKQIITARMQAEQDELLSKEAEANERNIIQLQTEKLQIELAGKNRELANSAMSLVYKNELLQKISQEILKLKDPSGKLLGEEQLRRIQKVIDEGMNDERDWNLFENSFNEAHESFFKKLKADHPDLVPNDLKLCAYLRMNMSSKEMASLLNISLRGVEIRRYRLRKKLDVPHDKNLVEFLMEL